LRIWVGTSEGDDLDVFVVLKKLDATRSEVFFSGFNGTSATVSPKDGSEHRIENWISRAARRSAHGTVILAFRSSDPMKRFR